MSAVLLPLPRGEGRGEGQPRVEEPSAKYLAQPGPAVVRNFDLLASSPGGVPKLREFILTLAVQGKLAPQDPSEEPASVLLKKIRVEKDRLLAEGTIKRDKLLGEIADEEVPCKLPSSWEWVRFGEASINRDGERIPVSSADRDSRAKIYDYYGASGVIDKIDGFLFDKTLLLIGEDGANLINRSTPIAFLAHGRYWVNNHAHVIDTTYPEMMNYLALFINAISLESYVTGTAQPKMNQAKLNGILVSLPPLAEQSRIVARVEELMRLCDALETKGRLEAAQHAQLVSTLLGTLTESETPEALAASWHRVTTHFDLLLDRPEAVDALEQTILQLAVRGLLVVQCSDDSPAQNLVGSSVGEASLDGVPLPTGWGTCRFEDLCSISGGSTPSKADARFWNGSIPWVSPKDMKVDLIRDAIDHVSQQALDQTNLSLVPAGSLLFVVRGMILAHSFPVAVTEVPITINQDIKALTPRSSGLAPYLALVCRGFKPEILAMVERSTHGTCKLESSKIFGWRFPLPPLAEQTRIVTRVESLRRLCADLRQRLSASQAAQAHLAEVLVEQVV